MRGISLKAIAIAFIAMLGLDIVSGVALIALFGGGSFAPDLTEQQARDAVAALTANQAYLIWSLVLGTFTTVVGGYITARMAQSLPYMNALVFGVLGIVFSMLMAEGLPLWFNVVGFGLMLPAALFGGHIAKRGMTANTR